MSSRGRGSDRGRGGGRGANMRGGRGSPDPRGRGGPPPSSRGGDHGGRGFRDRGGPRGRARGGVFLRGQPAHIDRRIADDSDKALVATFTHPRSDLDTMPLRPDFGTEGREIKLRTNFFPVRVPKGPLYEYDVAITPVMGTSVHRVKKRIYQLAEQTTAWQQAGMAGRVAHDNSAKLMAAFELPQPLAIRVQYYDEDEDAPHPGSNEYTLTINFTQEIDTSNLVSYLQGQVQYRNYDVLPVISALNLILASTPGRTGVMVGRNRYFFRTATQPASLGGGLEAWRGFYSSVRPAHKQLMVNVNVCTTAFYTPGNLAVAMMTFRDSSFGARMEVFCKGVRVRTAHLGHRKTVKRLARHTARTYAFDAPEFGRVTVEEYFERKYSTRLRHPELQLVDVGSQQRSIYLPPEVCEILPDQPYRGKLTEEHTANMITVACQPPNVNGESIVNQGLHHLGMSVPGPELQSFGVAIGPDMAVVPGRILPMPVIRYNTGSAAIDNKASWNLRGVKFALGARLEKWLVLVIKDHCRDEFAGPADPDLRRVMSGFRSMCNTSGMQVVADPSYTTAQLPLRDRNDPMRSAAIRTIKDTLTNIKAKPTLVFVMLASGDKAIYEGLKHLCDVYLDVASVCAQSSKIRKSSPQYFANVALKVNMKLGGINHKLDQNSARWLNSAPTMIVGMDVTHPSPGSAVGTPSIAAVVASVDHSYAQYPASLEMQDSKREMIKNLKGMMVDRLKLFQKKNSGKLPERVLVYRDGVSEGQFNIVREEERPLILEAFKTFGSPKAPYRPKLTIIICGKRHHTRFYPTEEDSAAGDGNPRPGTVVDRGVTAIYEFDFFLQAHGGLQGTTRPTHYYVVHDDIGFRANDIQGLTNSLSYMFARATKAVSLVSPAYYADVACERGRCYLRKLFHGLVDPTGASGTGSGSVMEQDVLREASNLWGAGVSKPGLRDTMFYL